MAMQPKNASDIITFTRLTAAWEWDWQGNYSEVAAGVMRIAHDPLTKSTSTTPQTLGTGSYTFAVTYQYPVGKAVRVSADANNWMVGRVTASTPDSVTIWVSGTPVGAGTYSSWTLIVRLGIRVEEQRTNLAARSSDLSAWILNGSATVTLDDQQSPGGTQNADTLNTGTLGYSGINRASGLNIVAGSVSWSIFVRHLSGGQKIRLGSDSAAAFGSGTAALATYSYDTNTFSSIGTAVTRTNVTIYPNGWRRIAVTATAIAAGNPAVVLYNGASAAASWAVWGLQLEQAAAESSYIPTGASQVIRAGDLPLVNTLAPWFNAAKGTLVVSGIKDAGVSALCNAVALDDGTGNNRIQLRHTGTTGGSGIVVVGGVAQAGSFAGPAGSWPIGESRKAALSYEENAFAFSCGGIAPLTDNAGAVPTVSRMVIGSAPGYSSAFNGILENITYHPRVTDTQQASA